MRHRVLKAQTFERFLAGAENSQHPWRPFHERAQVPEDLLDRARELTGRFHPLVLDEDWCGDGANTLPPLARLAEATPKLEFRILTRPPLSV